MKELKVGEKVTIILEAVEQREGCNGCFFDQGENIPCTYNCKCNRCTRSDHKNIILKEVKIQKKKMKEDKYSLKISRNSGDTTLDGYPIVTYSNDELKILKRLLTKVLSEVDEYIKD